MRAVQERVAVARQFAAGAADSFGADHGAIEDAKLAVTEACTNAATHAYDDAAGPLTVEARRAGDRILIGVLDAGRGGTPQAEERDSGRYGLALIEAVADTVSVSSASTNGTEVRMEFAVGPEPERISPEAPTYAPLVRRLVSLLAAEAGFSLDRLADAVLAAETVIMHAGGHVPGGMLGVRLEDSGPQIGLRLGPLTPGGAETLLHEAELPGVGSLVERLANEVRIEPAEGAGDFLKVSLGNGA